MLALHFSTNISSQDFEAIGINKRGFQLKLAKEAKKLCKKEIEISSVSLIDERVIM